MNMAKKTRVTSHGYKHCGQLFDQLSRYQEHGRTNTGEKPHTCKYCEKCLCQLGNCKRHERTRTCPGVKAYVCKHCKKEFSHSSDCKKHERIHTGEKPYICKHCEKGFSQSSDCKKHERTHTGEKPYTCKYCEKCFRQLSDCKRHERKHAIRSPLKEIQHDQCFKLKRHGREPISARGCKSSRILSSLTEKNSSEVESLTCWICQEELSSKKRLIKHYDEHMR